MSVSQGGVEPHEFFFVLQNMPGVFAFNNKVGTRLIYFSACTILIIAERYGDISNSDSDQLQAMFLFGCEAFIACKWKKC